ncbi:MAG: nicotinate phosphoribosyltransferase [Candidatus Bathyarchaeia archaeon]
MVYRFHVAEPEAIKRGDVTDIYYKRTKEVVEKKGLSGKRVVMDVHAYSMPKGYDWCVLAGLEEAVYLFEGLNVDVYSMREGTLFRRYQPVFRVEGSYLEFGVLEAALLGILRHASSVATKAARCKKAANGKTIIFFGIRAVHPAITPMIDRAAFIGGCDAVSGTYGAELIGEKPVGTIPHELILLFGEQTEALKAFDEVMPEDVPRVMLCDTWFDERVEALLAAKTLGAKLYGVRFDTPASRRGDIRRILEETRWALDMNGFRHVKLVLSSGIDEYKIAEVVDLVDIFGVGTSIACAPSVEFAFDIVEVDGRPTAKKGKLPGRKEVYRCQACFRDQLVPSEVRVERCPYCSGELKPLLLPIMKGGKLLYGLPKPRDIRTYVLEQLSKVEMNLKAS